MEWEKSAAQGWLLPQYGRVTKASSDERPSVAPPKPPTTSKPQGPRQGPKQQPVVSRGNSAGRPGSQATSGRSQGAASAPKAPKTGAQNKGRQGQRAAASQNAMKVFRDSPAKGRWRAGMNPDGFVQLPAEFGTFRHAFSRAVRSTTPQSNTKAQPDLFEDVSRKTGSYVKPATYSDRFILIWGEQSQVSAAKDLLRGVLAKCSESMSARRGSKWERIRPVNPLHPVDKEDNSHAKEQREAKLTELRKVPESLSASSHQLMFIWPDDGLPIQAGLGAQLEKLDFLRARYNVHLYQDESTNCVCVIGDNVEVLKHITRTLRIIYQEITAKSEVRIKVYIVEPPPPSAMRSGIVMKKGGYFAKAFLHGDQLDAPSVEKWRIGMDLLRDKNNTLLLSSVQKALAAIPFLRGHLRMRVNFGSFVMEKYQRPQKDLIAYSFDEFNGMVLHEQNKGRLVPGLKVGQDELLERCFRADFLELMGAPASTPLSEVEPKFSANLEFEGKNDALLRLEVEFSRIPGGREFEVRQSRWLSARRGSELSRFPLQVGVMDFTRSDWQFAIKSFEFQPADAIGKSLDTFSRTIHFQHHPSARSIVSKPHRKVRFGPAVTVARFVEKAALRFRVKGTPYILELARFDEYRPIETLQLVVWNRPATPPPVEWSSSPRVSWGASLLAPDWDNMLGGQANLGAGYVAQHRGDLSAFFPSADEADMDDAAGFWKLMEVVQKIADLLGPAQTTSSSNNGYQDMTDLLDIEMGTLF